MRRLRLRRESEKKQHVIDDRHEYEQDDAEESSLKYRAQAGRDWSHVVSVHRKCIDSSQCLGRRIDNYDAEHSCPHISRNADGKQG